nr:phospholipase-like protein [Tanacetum cinerariifolium]
MPNAVVMVACMGIDKPDRHNDNPNANDNDINQGIDPMSTCFGPDMHLGEVAVAAIEMDKGDGHIDIPTASDNDVNLAKFVFVNDSMNNNPRIDFLQHDDHVDCCVAKPNGRSTADIGVKPIQLCMYENEFTNDFMDVLNDKQSLLKVSLDDINVDEQEEKLINTVKAQSNKSDSVNVVTDDYKPCLASVFAQRKKRLAMALNPRLVNNHLLFQSHLNVYPEVSTTISFCPDFKEPKIRSINELMTMKVFVEHIDLWVDLMWCFRQPDTDWAMVSTHFLPCTLGGNMIDCYSNGVRYPVKWRDVEKVYFPVNEPKRQWCLAELHITTGVITFYDSLGWFKTSWASLKHWSILSRLFRHALKEFPKIEKSSMNTLTDSLIISWNIANMHLWNVAGALHRPKGIRL